MKRIAFDLLLLVVLAIGLAPAGARAAESYDACTNVIAALPATISTQGTWCLDQDFVPNMASGNAITITAHHVTIDCNGFRIDNTAAGGATNAIGIASTEMSNLTIRNCDIRGFRMGLRIYGSTGGHVIEDNRFQQNRYVGANVHGPGSVVRRNLVLDTGGSTIADFAMGIYTNFSVDVLDNTVSGVVARVGSVAGNAYGIHTEANTAGNVSGNRIRGVTRQGTGSSWGIYNSNSGRVTLADNDLVSLSPTNAYGLRCENNQGSSTGNIINGFAAGHVGCSPDGNNVVAP
jgi:nitrous oxidase accessory protein NosD